MHNSDSFRFIVSAGKEGVIMATYQAVGAGLSIVIDSLPESGGVACVAIHVMQHLQARLVHGGVVPIQPTAKLKAWNQEQQSKDTCIRQWDQVAISQNAYSFSSMAVQTTGSLSTYLIR